MVWEDAVDVVFSEGKKTGKHYLNYVNRWGVYVYMVYGVYVHVCV